MGIRVLVLPGTCGSVAFGTCGFGNPSEQGSVLRTVSIRGNVSNLDVLFC